MRRPSRNGRGAIGTVEMLVMKRAIRIGEYSTVPESVAKAARARAEYRDRRDELLVAMEATEAEAKTVNIAAGLVALADDDPQLRKRAQELHERAARRSRAARRALYRGMEDR
jgi:hypothetical protein